MISIARNKSHCAINENPFLAHSLAIALAVVLGGALPSESGQPEADVATTNGAAKIVLILDRDSVATATGVSFHLNPAKKHPENPILLPGEPQHWDSLQVIWPGTVLYDAQERLFRCWYSGLDAVQSQRLPNLWVPGYAESADGIHWKKPDLGQYQHRGQPTNRIVANWEHYQLSCVWANPDRSDPQRRFLSLWTELSKWEKGLASSPDGKVWKREKAAYRASRPERVAFQDIYQILYQPEAADPQFRVIGYGQLCTPQMNREIGMVHGPDVGNLHEPADPFVLHAEPGIDEQLHFASVAKVGDTFLMLFESDRFTKNHGDLRLAVSNDGRKFRRIHPTTPLVPTGPKGTWDENLLVTTSAAIQEVRDEVWLYYFGCPNVFKNWPNGSPRGSLFYPSYLGVATLPRDRFAYAAGPGSLTLRPLACDRDGLWLNADGDTIRVEALDGAGKVTAQGALGPETSHTVYRKVRWEGAVPKGPTTLQIQLPAGVRLYSVRGDK
jgi:hypothetical protein